MFQLQCTAKHVTLLYDSLTKPSVLCLFRTGTARLDRCSIEQQHHAQLPAPAQVRSSISVSAASCFDAGTANTTAQSIIRVEACRVCAGLSIRTDQITDQKVPTCAELNDAASNDYSVLADT